MIIKTLEKNKDKAISNRWRLVDLVNHLKKYLEETDLFQIKPQQLEDEAWKWVLYNSLLSIGELAWKARPVGLFTIKTQSKL